MATETLFPDLKGNEVLHLTGEKLRENTEATGFSVLGNKALTLTDRPAAYVYDGGGILGEELRLQCTSRDDMQLFLDSESTRLRICVRFAPKQKFDSTCTTMLKDRDLKAAIGWYAKTRKLSLITPLPLSAEFVWKDREADGGFVELSEKNGRISVSDVAPFRKPRTVLDIPKEHVSANVEDGFVFLELNSSTPKGVLLGVKLHCPYKAMRKQIAAHVAAAAPSGNMLLEKVQVAGLGKKRKMDCVLLGDKIVLSETNNPSDKTEVFLTDESVRVAGSTASFVLFSPRLGALHISETSEAFTELAMKHERLSALARETLSDGPYPGLSSSRPVSLHFGESGWAVRGDGVTAEGAFADTQCSAKSTAKSAALRIATGGQSLNIAFPPDLAEAVHARLRARQLEGQDVPARDRAVAVLGLEEDWLISTLAGPVLLLHAGLTGGLSEPALGRATEEKHGAAFALGLTGLRRHFDMVIHALPAFFTSQDRGMLGAEAKDSELKPMEAQLRGAVAPLGRALSEVVRLYGKLERIADYNPENIPKGDYTLAALSVLGGVTINPLLAYSGASQAFNMYSSSSERLRVAEATAERVWASLMSEWDVFVSELLPILIYNVTENTFPIRSRFYANARGDLTTRLAALDVRRMYPCAPGSGLARREVVAHIKQARGEIEYPAFTAF
ncbi:MAG: hypothetical protein AAGA87_03465 [Pseudomonadota bacterium]